MQATGKRLLVANRSEIACRIFQTCEEMGMIPVALCAAGDEEARHVTFAREVLAVPSYLDLSAIVTVAKEAKVDMIHPGYGFLSEKPEFAEAVEKAGITFIGPKSETMLQMGDKIEAKKLAEAHDVPTLPWVQLEGQVQKKNLENAAQQVGFPLLLKAAAGGGGKGMRLVERAEDLLQAAESAMREAEAAFGEGSLFMERFCPRPRHIEVQVFGDGKGGGQHLFERECSLQRRHQKVWEEAPALNLAENVREEMFAAALRLVKATAYRGAGTVEFLYDHEASAFYFLEMNTRLQVEHPVTEWITGVDLVRAQIQQALGVARPLCQEQLAARGHAIEVRIYAEDAAQGFMPTPGRVEKLVWPQGIGIRVESGIEEGQQVSSNFDPMLAKLTVYAADRPQAMARLAYALRETVILGLGSNLSYLQAIAQHPAVVEAQVHTAFLEQELGDYFPAVSTQELPLLEQALQQGLGGVKVAKGTSNAFPSPWFEGGT